MRIAFLGMPGRLSGPALLALLDAGADLAAVLVPAPPGSPPVAPAPALAPRPGTIHLSPGGPGHLPAPPTQPPPPGSPRSAPLPARPSPHPGILTIAAQRSIPALALGGMGSLEAAEALAALAPDLAVVVCWPWRIPPRLLAAPRLGFLNLHPSPLPELRGPEPLFWALREGRERTAVTAHWMDASFDTGAIAAVAPVELPEGIGWDEVEDRAAQAGAQLLGRLLPRLDAGEVPRQPQGPGGSYQPAPRDEAFSIDPTWPARRAFRFMRGVAGWGVPFSLEADGHVLMLGTALGYDPEARLGAPAIVTGDVARVQLSPGVLEATVASG